MQEVVHVQEEAHRGRKNHEVVGTEESDEHAFTIEILNDITKTKRNCLMKRRWCDKVRIHVHF